MKRHRTLIIVLLFLFILALVAAVMYRYRPEKKAELRVRHEVRPSFVKSFDFNSEGALDGWEEKKLAGKKTEYSVSDLDGKRCVKAFSDDSASALYHKEKYQHKRDPVISWEWKARKFPDYAGKESLEEKEGFDFVAQVYVVFDSRFFLNAKAIQYVWTESIPRGEVSPSPYTDNVMIKVLESGPSDEWKSEERDIRKDYRELFGVELEKDVAAVSFMTDADSTDSTAEAYYDNIRIGYMEAGTEKGTTDGSDGN